ncbi:MAG: L-aspartate oxidase [Acidobacteria bacterium]|nr:L-aspartate oxidase [Acidobacteriota bacterium]
MNDLGFEAEYIVVGSGIAGLRAAIDLAPAGPVTIFTKAETTESNSIYAQGGIAAAVGPDDDPERHYEDTLKAGAGLCDPEAVRILVEEGPREIERLLDWGADFEKDGQALSLSREGGHSRPRIVHGNGGLTGKVVVDALLAKIQALANIRIIPFTMFRDLILDGDRVAGIEYEDAGGTGACHSRSTLVATGGGSQVYQESTNPQTATGDGLAAAYRAGAELRDMEFIQFHPTVLNIPGAPRFLLTEALRGEGARIVNESGERFVDELFTRDEVSRAVYRQLTGRPGGKVFLDVKHIAPELIRKKFRHVYTTCLQYGLDIMQQPIPITPAAHYFMGGIRTDLSGRTSLGGLYAAGEVASTGVHGANRLASNSLLEALVFGGRAAAAMREEPPAHSGRVGRANSGAPSSADSVARIQETTWRYAGLVRNAAGLGKGIEILAAIETAGGPRAQNLLAVSRVILESALARAESRGAHYRDDFPVMGPARLHSYCRKDQPAVLR